MTLTTQAKYFEGVSVAQAVLAQTLRVRRVCARARTRVTSLGSQPGCTLVTWDVVADDVTDAKLQ
jgi:hypothetical protein